MVTQEVALLHDVTIATSAFPSKYVEVVVLCPQKEVFHAPPSCGPGNCMSEQHDVLFVQVVVIDPSNESQENGKNRGDGIHGWAFGREMW